MPKAETKTAPTNGSSTISSTIIAPVYCSHYTASTGGVSPGYWFEGFAYTPPTPVPSFSSDHRYPRQSCSIPDCSTLLRDPNRETFSKSQLFGLIASIRHCIIHSAIYIIRSVMAYWIHQTLHYTIEYLYIQSITAHRIY